MYTEEEAAYRKAIQSFCLQLREWSEKGYKSHEIIQYGKAEAYEEVAEHLEFLLNDNVRGILKSG